tara:strand:- start:3062 stop:3340 length:279 start_codon:yes stop_codon:yes gene_type:complete
VIASIDYPQAAAILGSVTFLLSYAYINRKIDAKNDLVYLSMNLFASVLMLYSLTTYWNIGVLINNGSWIVISSYSLFKHFQRLKNNGAAGEN